MTVPRGRSGLHRRLTTFAALLLLAAAPGEAAVPDPLPLRAASPERALKLGRRVVLVTPELGNDVAAAVVTRLRGELRAASFDMDVVSMPADVPRRDAVEQAAIQSGALGALGIFFTAGRVEMWAADASAGRTLMQNLPLDSGAPDRRAAVVAVKAVDLLKALLADIWTVAPTATATTPSTPDSMSGAAAATPSIQRPAVPAIDAAASAASAAPAEAETSAPAAGGDRFAIIAGAGWLQAGAASGWAPLAALSAAIGGGRLGARLTVSALGPSVDVSATAGTAVLAQEIALLELLIWSREWHRLRAMLAVGAGAHHLSVDGHGAPGFAGVNHGLWSAATTAGGGITLAVLSRLVVALDARAVENWPATTVQIDGMRAARVGRPIFWLALGAGVRFP